MTKSRSQAKILEVATCKVYEYCQNKQQEAIKDIAKEILPDWNYARIKTGTGLIANGMYKKVGDLLLGAAGLFTSEFGIGLLGVAGGGYLAYVGDAQVQQGLQEIFYGTQNDSVTPTTTPVVETIYDGRYDIYDVSTNVAASMGYAEIFAVTNTAESASVAAEVVEGSSNSGKYQVGLYEDIKGVEGMGAHHVGQKAIMKNLVENYDYQKAPAINVSKVGHTISGPNGIVSRSTKGITNARPLLARDLFELKRVYPDIPNSKLRELIDLNMELYPEMRK